MRRSIPSIATWFRSAASRALPAAALVATGAVASGACGGDALVPEPLLSEANLYWRLDLNHKAVLLSVAPPYDTLQLVATPRNHLGHPIADAPAPVFISRDIAKVVVTPEGRLHAVAPTTAGTVVPIIARLSAHRRTHIDTVFVSVVSTDPPPTLGSLSIQPIPPDSAKVAATQSAFGGVVADTIAVRAFDTDGNPILTIPGSPTGGVLPVRLTVADTSIAQFDEKIFGTLRYAVIRGYRVGTTVLRATTTAFGVTKSDSLGYRVGWPIYAGVLLAYPGKQSVHTVVLPGENVFTRPVVKVGVGGVVALGMWGLAKDPSINTTIMFKPEDLVNIGSVTPRPSYLPANDYAVCFLVTTKLDCAGTGDFLVDSVQAGGMRRFLVPGTYEVRSSQFPNSMTQIVVIDES